MFCTNLQSPVCSDILVSTVCSNPVTFVVVVVVVFSGGTATAFALTTCTAASIRETDDPTNWAIGGVASAVFMGLASKLPPNLMLLS